MTVAISAEGGYTLTRLRDEAVQVRNPVGVLYRVTTSPALSCSCPGFRFRKSCKHLGMLREAGMIADTLAVTGNDRGEVVVEPDRAEVSVPAGKSLGRLASALRLAQQSCKAVQHDAHNKNQNYWYTSSEAIIGEGKRALADAGLALLPVRQSLNGWERNGEDRFELERHFLLLHTSGEAMPLCVHWPVCPGKGRPLDKATGAAATLSLSYLLRDLLLMPRVNEADEVNARDDTPPAQGKTAARPGDDERVGEQEARELDVLLGRTKTDWTRLRDEWFRTKFPDVDAGAQTADLTVKQAKWLKEKLLSKFAKQQLAEAVRS